MATALELGACTATPLPTFSHSTVGCAAYTVSALHELVVKELLSHGGGGAEGASTPRLAICAAEVYLDHVRDLAPPDHVHAAATSAPTTFGGGGGGGHAAAAGVVAAGGTMQSGISAGEIALTWHTVADAAEAEARVAAANERRVTADNGINVSSSRSHLVSPTPLSHAEIAAASSTDH